MPHVDTNITNEKLTYKEIKKPFETQTDELHNAIRDKLMKKQLRKQRREMAIAEYERSLIEREKLLLAEFTRDQVYAAMTYFRTMCARLSQDAEDKGKKKSQNQIEAEDEDNLTDNATTTTANSKLKKGGGNPQKHGGGKIATNKNKKYKALPKGDRTAASVFKEGRVASEHDDEIKLNELEAVVRKFKRAKATVEDEEYGRGLLLSLEWLLDELDLSPMEWFVMVTAEAELRLETKSQRIRASRHDMLCDELSALMSANIRDKQREERLRLEDEVGATELRRRRVLRAPSKTSAKK